MNDVVLISCFRDQYVHLPQVWASKGNASGDGGGTQYHDRVAIRAQLFAFLDVDLESSFAAAALLMIESEAIPSLIASLDLLHRIDQAFHRLQKSK